MTNAIARAVRIAFTHNLQTNPHDEAQAEFDTPTTVAAIAAALRDLGHDVTLVDVSGPVAPIIDRLVALAPDLVFNTAEGQHGRFREAFWPALFDQLGFAYTGSDAYVCAVTLDKQITKMLVAAAGVPTPKWVFVDDMSQYRDPKLRFPVIIKPNFEGSSKGITVDSVVEEASKLRSRVEDILRQYPSGLLIEEFIIGRDVVVPYLAAASTDTKGVLAPVSYRFDEAIIGKRKYQIYDYQLKCVSSDAVEVEVPAPVSAVTLDELHKHSLRVFQTLGVRDLGRIDWRVDDDGKITFLEINALPSLEPGAGIYLSAALAGLGTTAQVLDAVINSAAARVTTPQPKQPRVALAYNLKRTVAKRADDDDSDAEYDSQTTIDGLAAALRSLGVDVVPIEADAYFPRTLAAANVDAVFNLAEGAHGRAREAQVPAVCEMLGLPFTGSDAVTMSLCLDKQLAKAVVAQAGIDTPRAQLMTGDEPLQVRLPALAKPNAEGSSKGVHPSSVARTETELRDIVRTLYRRYQQPILVEEFLPGREFTVGILGDGPHGTTATTLSPMEIVFLRPAESLPIYSFADKLDWNDSLRYDRPAVMDDALKQAVLGVAVGAWRALGCRDVARVDIRINAQGKPSFIECNPLPGLSPGWSDLCLIAEADGVGYTALIARIARRVFAELHASRYA
jgi:D-alanine-D-alanine ligase